MSTTIRRPILVSCALGAALALSASPAHAAPITLSEGHVDVVDIAYEDGSLELGLHDETTGTPVERDPADVELHVKPEAETTVPDEDGYEFLGSPGDPVWILPETNNPDLLYAGLAAHEVPADTFENDEVELNLTDVSGPGDVSVFKTTDGAPDKYFDSGDGLPDAINVEADAHTHVNWAFEAEGTYTLTFQATGTLSDGTTVTSEEVDYHFTVG